MNRILFLLVIPFLFGSSLYAQSKKKLKELKVKTSTETVTLYKDGKQTSSYKSEYNVYDKDGNTTQKTEYNADGTVKRKETRKYSGDNKIEEVTEHPNDADNNSGDDAQKKYKKTTWKYNSSGDKTEEAEYDAAGALVEKKTYVYNKNGDLQFEMEYDASGLLVKKTAYGYDTKGLKTEKKVYGANDVLEKSITYTYTY
jgi:hypothetical protein